MLFHVRKVRTPWLVRSIATVNTKHKSLGSLEYNGIPVIVFGIFVNWNPVNRRFRVVLCVVFDLGQENNSDIRLSSELVWR